MSKQSELEILANFIMAEVEGEPSKNEGAGTTAVRIIKQLQAEMKEKNKYQITIRYSMRIGQSVFIIKANRENKCLLCRHTGFWKYYVKPTKITAIGVFIGINGKQEVYYYYKNGTDKWCHMTNTIIYLTKKEAQEACDIENNMEKK